MSEADVVRQLGNPPKKAILGEKTVFQYADATITFVNGKVTDVVFK
jgi:hypothetical protein